MAVPPISNDAMNAAQNPSLSANFPLSAVLLPGLDGTGKLFAPLIAAAPVQVQCAVVDYPRHDANVEILSQHVRQRMTGPCILIAESFSGPIAVRVASDSRVEALILCNSFVSPPVLPALRHFFIPAFFKLPRPSSILGLLLLGRHADAELVDRAQRAIREVSADVLAQRVRETLMTDERETLRSLRKPILYLRGTNDRLLWERSWKEILNIRPDAKVVSIGGPHLLLQTLPTECWRAILGFIGEVRLGMHPFRGK